MKKNILKFVALTFMLFCMTGCVEDPAENYNVGDEVIVGDVEFYIYKTDYNKLYLITKDIIATTSFYEKDQYGDSYYESLVSDYVSEFSSELVRKGVKIEEYRLIEREEMQDLGCDDPQALNGRKLLCENAPSFIKIGKSYWVDSYSKFSSYAWGAYDSEKNELDYTECEKDLGVRPIIVVEPSQVQ